MQLDSRAGLAEMLTQPLLKPPLMKAYVSQLSVSRIEKTVNEEISHCLKIVFARRLTWATRFGTYWPMKLLLINDNGEIAETFDLDEMNLEKPLARADLILEIREAVAKEQSKQQGSPS